MTNSRVKEVKDDKILFTQKDDNGQVTTKELPMGFCLWSTGVCELFVYLNKRAKAADRDSSPNRNVEENCKETGRTK